MTFAVGLAIYGTLYIVIRFMSWLVPDHWIVPHVFALLCTFSWGCMLVSLLELSMRYLP